MRIGSTYRTLVLAILLLSAPTGSALAADSGMTGSISLPAHKRTLGLNAPPFQFLPSIKLLGQYNSNLFYAHADDEDGPEAGWMFRAMPGFRVLTPNASTLSVNAGGHVEFRKYFHDRPQVTEQSSIGGRAGIRATFFRTGPVSLSLSEEFRRVLERRNVEVTDTWDRHYNRVGADVHIKPGGQALALRVGYGYVTDYFTDTTQDWGDIAYHDINGRFTWKFLPFTAALAEVSWQMRDYLDDEGGYYGELTDSKPLKARIGLNGFITKRLSLLLMAGWGHSFHSERSLEEGEQTNSGENDSYNSFLAEVRVSLKPTPSTVLQASYKHDFRDSYFSNFITYDSVMANAQQRLFRILDLSLNVAFHNLKYATLPYKYKTAKNDLLEQFGGWDRNDNMLVIGAAADLDLMRYLKFNVSYKFSTLITEYYVKNRTDVLADNMGYNLHVISAGLILRY